MGFNRHKIKEAADIFNTDTTDIWHCIYANRSIFLITFNNTLLFKWTRFFYYTFVQSIFYFRQVHSHLFSFSCRGILQNWQ